MPRRNANPPPPDAAAKAAPRSFQLRYDELEWQREALLARLTAVGKARRAILDHPACKRARRLLNLTFRNVPVHKRAAVLQSAAWLIGIIEQIALSL